MLTRSVKNYIERHQNRANQLFHLVGVPVTFVAPWILLSKTENDWRWFWACFVFGYILQFIGHAIEGNDAGEVCLIKKLLGKPYQEFRPGYEPDRSESVRPDPASPAE
jgi:hypothetical protein